MKKKRNNPTSAARERRKARRVAFALPLLLLCTHAACLAQGTMTFTFDGQPPGTQASTSLYTEAGMNFWNPYGPQDPEPTGPGVNGLPQNGTGYLDMPGTAQLTFSFASPTDFRFVSFDAARESTVLSATNLEVVGYGPMVTVTNLFALDSLANRRANNLPDFQTFYLDSQFQHVYRVDIFNDRFCFDNATVSGVPEPSSTALLAFAAAAFWSARRRAQRAPRLP